MEGYPAPLFFAQTRDMVAYLKSPERDAIIIGVYVSDMGVAPNWAQPGINNWVLAQDAHFVVGAKVAGGMGAQEVVPFKEVHKAANFAAQWGGQIMSLDAIPTEAVLGPIDLDQTLETPS